MCMYHYYAKGVPSFLDQDLDSAIDWMNKASEQGSLESTLALFYLHTRAVDEQDGGNEDKLAHMSAACNRLREAADKGVRARGLVVLSPLCSLCRPLLEHVDYSCTHTRTKTCFFFPFFSLH